MTWNPKSAKGNWISFSEASCLAKCEMLWSLQYRHDTGREPGQKMLKGTLFHVGSAAFWEGKDWVEALAEENATNPEMTLLSEETWDDAIWLLERYTRHYADLRPEVKVVETELELTATLPGTKTNVMGHLDQIWQLGKGKQRRLWFREAKSYGSRDRIDLVTVDPQMTLYAWLARENGIDVYGIVFDGAYTYRWKPEKPTQKQVVEEAIEAMDEAVGDVQPPWLAEERWLVEADHHTVNSARQAWARAAVERHPGVERPDSDSFDMLWLDRTPPQLVAATDWLRAAVSRRNALRRGAEPLRNIGPLCKGCDAKETCFTGLAFPQEIELVSSVA